MTAGFWVATDWRISTGTIPWLNVLKACGLNWYDLNFMLTLAYLTAYQSPGLNFVRLSTIFSLVVELQGEAFKLIQVKSNGLF